MIDPLVRLARPADLAELRSLEALARDGLADARGGPRWLDEHPEIGENWVEVVAETPETDGRRCFVAVIDEVVVGYLVLVIDAEGTARVDQVFVHREARECGFGDALIEAAIAAAREAGAVRIEGQTLPGDRDIKNLYERAGITARLITVSAPLHGR